MGSRVLQDFFRFAVGLYVSRTGRELCVVCCVFEIYKDFFLHLRQHEAASLNILVSIGHRSRVSWIRIKFTKGALTDLLSLLSWSSVRNSTCYNAHLNVQKK